MTTMTVQKIFLFLLISLAAGCGGSSVSEPEKTSRHYFFGDSITLGFGVSDAKGYVAVYADRLDAKRSYRIPTPVDADGGISGPTLASPMVGNIDSNFQVTRDGGGGRPIVSASGAGLLRDYMTTVRPAAPFDVLVLQMGINDSIQNEWKNTTPEQFKINLIQLVTLAKQDASRVYILAPTYASITVLPSVLPYIDIMEQVAVMTGVGIITPDTDATWYGADIYHPNEVGYRSIGIQVFNAINP